jgi:hypothetical protein
VLIPTPPVCQSTINQSTGAVAAGTYFAKERIESAGTIATTGKTNYFANQSITLKPGFVSSNGTTFLVEVKTCN